MIRRAHSPDDTPRVSVIMAVHNGERFLQEAVHSVLGQSFADFECIVVNDASTDGTAAILESCHDHRLILLNNPVNLGLTRSLVRAMAMARGQYIARLDADDVCEPRRLARQVAAMDARPELTVLGSWYTLIDEHGRVIGHREPPCEPGPVAWELCWGSPLCHSSVMMRRRVVLDAGGYDPAVPLAQDYELWTRLVMLGHRLAILPEHLVRYRRTATQIVAARYVDHTAAAQRVLQRYHAWLLRQPAPLDLCWRTRDLIYERKLAAPGDPVFALLAPVQATLSAWRNRLPTAAGRQLERHVLELLLQMARQHTYSRPAGAAAAITARAMAISPRAWLDQRLWRQWARVLRYGVLGLGRGLLRATAQLGHEARECRRHPLQWARRQSHLHRLRRRVRQHLRTIAQHRRRLGQQAARRPIIAINLIGGLGDLVTAEPIVRHVRGEHPQAFLVWCVQQALVDMVQDHPEIDGVIPVCCWAELDELIQRRVFDHVVDLHIPGWGCDVCRRYKATAELPLRYDNYYHFGRTNLEVLCRVGGFAPLDEPPRLFLSPRWAQAAGQLNLPERYVVIHAKSSELERDWTLEGWQQVAQYLLERGLPVIEVGTRPLLKPQPPQLRSLCDLSPALTAQVIRRCELFIGVDSGPGQIANAVGVPGVILLGHFRGFNFRYMPYSGRYADPHCATLLYADGPLQALPPQRVIEAIEQRLERAPSATASHAQPTT